jgi:hypothetical protein
LPYPEEHLSVQVFSQYNGIFLALDDIELDQWRKNKIFRRLRKFHHHSVTECGGVGGRITQKIPACIKVMSLMARLMAPGGEAGSARRSSGANVASHCIHPAVKSVADVTQLPVLIFPSIVDLRLILKTALPSVSACHSPVEKRSPV